MSFIPDRILAELSSMSAPEAMCTMVLARATYGRQRKRAWLTYADFQERTMFKGTATIARALKAVVARGFFRRCPGQGSNWEIVAETGGEGTGLFFCAGEQVAAEAGSGGFEGGAARAEGSGSEGEGQFSLSEGRAPHDAEHGPINGPEMMANGPKNGPLPFYKERSVNGHSRERERKKTRARNDAPEGGLGEDGEWGTGKGEWEAPRPRTAAERELAEHPGTKAWLGAGLEWPGWKRLRLITRRLGRNPQEEALARANEFWLMAGYRPGNFGGILDWYESICDDASWRPFTRTGGQVGPIPAAQSGAYPPPDPTMAMLLQMQEELTHGTNRDDRAMFNITQGLLSEDDVRPAVGRGLPDGTG